jgi:hypothetical protein
MQDTHALVTRLSRAGPKSKVNTHTKSNLIRHDLLQPFIRTQCFIARRRRGKLNDPDLRQAGGRVIPHDRFATALATAGDTLPVFSLSQLEREPLLPGITAHCSRQVLQ